jgi:hypothetical protein
MPTALPWALSVMPWLAKIEAFHLSSTPKFRWWVSLDLAFQLEGNVRAGGTGLCPVPPASLRSRTGQSPVPPGQPFKLTHYPSSDKGNVGQLTVYLRWRQDRVRDRSSFPVARDVGPTVPSWPTVDLAPSPIALLRLRRYGVEAHARDLANGTYRYLGDSCKR